MTQKPNTGAPNTSTSSIPKLTLITALSMIGFGVSVYLTQHYYEIRGGTASFKSLCNLGQAMDCDVVAASRYAELVGGLPLSSFAAGWFLALAVIAWVARNAFWRREAVRALFAMSTVGLLLTAYYLFVMAVVLKTYCLFCLVTDGVTLAVFAIALSLRPEGTREHKLDLSKWKNFATITLVAVIGAVLGLRTMESEGLSATTIDELVNSSMNTPVLPVRTDADLPSIGPANAPITLVEFSDFQCPFCKKGALIINTLLKHYPTQLRVVFRNFPLSSDCNRQMDRPMHPYACEAAKHVVCAHKQGKFEAVYETLFEHQETLSKGIPKLAQEAGADPQAMAACVSAPETIASISRDVEEGIQLGLHSTPTFFLNGHKIEGAYPPPVWIKIIDSMLKQLLAKN